MGGHGSLDTEYYPRVIEILRSLGIIDIAAGMYHSMAVSEDGKVFSWGSPGWDVFGQLGHPNLYRQSVIATPTVIDWFGDNGIRAIACYAGYDHSAVISDKKELYLFGKNADSQLGFSKYVKNTTHIPTKLNISGINKIRQISLGHSHTMVIATSKVNDKDTLAKQPLLSQSYTECETISFPTFN